MFTGIVEELGEILRVHRDGDSGVVTVRGPRLAPGLRAGGSVAVDGCCLTVLDRGRGTPSGGVAPSDGFDVDVMGETFSRTTLGDRRPGDAVNLERAVPATGRLEGHLVQGHVDGTGRIAGRERHRGWDLVRIELPADLAGYVAEKGSVAVDGVSLTVIEVAAPDTPDPWFTVGLIPTTLRETTLGRRQRGDRVNLEVDVLAKYVERLLAARPVAGSMPGPATGTATSTTTSTTGAPR